MTEPSARFERLTGLIEHYGTTAAAVSHEAGYDRTTLRALLNRPTSKLRPRMAEDFARVLRCTPEYLLGLSDEITYHPDGLIFQREWDQSGCELAARLRHFREKCEMSQRDVAVRLGLTGAGYAAYETGRNKPSARRRAELCDIFGLADRSLERDEIEPEVQRFLKKVDPPAPTRVVPAHPAPSTPAAPEPAKDRIDFRSEGADLVRVDIDLLLPFDGAMEVIALARKLAASRPVSR